jgi:hypothetical protein
MNKPKGKKTTNCRYLVHGMKNCDELPIWPFWPLWNSFDDPLYLKKQNKKLLKDNQQIFQIFFPLFWPENFFIVFSLKFEKLGSY